MSEGYGSRWDAKQERKDSAQSTKNEVPQWMHEAAKEIGGMLSRRNEFHLMGVDVKEASRIIASHAPQLPADRESDSPTQILPRGEQTSYNCQPEVAAPPSKPDAEGKWPRYFEPVNDRGIHQRIVFDSEIAVGRWADGTTDVAINAGFAEYLKGDESYIETDAEGNALPTVKKELLPVFSMSDVFGTMTFHQQHEGRYATGETPSLGDVIRCLEAKDDIATGSTLTVGRIVRGGGDVCRWVGFNEHSSGLDYFPQRFALVRRAEFAHVPVNSLNSSNGSDSGYDDRDMVASEADAANELLTKKINEIAGLRQQIETLRVQWNDERNLHEEEYAALRRRGIKFVKFGGVLEAIDGRCQEKPDNLTYEEIESRIERCVVSEDARDYVSGKELQEICSLFLKIRDQRDVMRDALEKCQVAFADATIVNGPGNGKGKYYAIGVAASVELALNPIEGA